MTAGRGIVQEYQNPQPGSTGTLNLDAKSTRAILRNGVHRPKGYTVSYHHNPDVEQHHFGQSHPMKPWRLTLTNKLVLGYGMDEGMDMYSPRAATKEELNEFHTEDYLNFLESVTPNAIKQYEDILPSFNIGDDCPIFDGIYEYCSLYSGASVDAARKIINHQSSIAINWSGGLHHAKKSEASGFCYVNDIVLAILQLLRHHPRVLYIDIDIHHGDGVEAAFWSTDRVLTLSFHKYDKLGFFPGTGPLDCTGPTTPLNPGSHHCLNVPLNDGVEDDEYIALFKKIVDRTVATYRPSVIVLQCGADSLGCDRIGRFNLNIRAHGECVRFAKSLNLPLIILGGGGYTPRNVARLWAYETSVCLGAEVPAALPADMPFIEHFKPDKTLFPNLAMGKYKNENTTKSLNDIVEAITETLRYLNHSPSVQMSEIPPDLEGLREEVEQEIREEREMRDENGEGAALRQSRESGAGRSGELYT
ncbi:hypothetical protein FGG08_002130 [Glutinoglossum americanum]|uniref:Histone deacetylase n=1 Tax=Glutinoglossum americanum TaxID=1670608 RepID=A0A9P8L4R6_9PEZI|nr:hypothetical protein FGG08_002130 [Glutinoglossum americanum]